MPRNRFIFVRPLPAAPAERPAGNLITPRNPAVEPGPERPRDDEETCAPLEEQETTRGLGGGKRRRISLGDLGKVAGFLL